MGGRVDIWDVSLPKEVELKCGFPPLPADKYEWGRQLGQGGFGAVRVLKDRSGTEFACKSIKKKLQVPGMTVAPPKQLQHLENIKREVAVLRKLRGTLNVVYLEDAFEDDTHVHIVMENCRGGELVHRIGKRHYSERTLPPAPGNFMLLNEADNSPLKAIDFGLACFFDPDKLPCTDLGLDGTPWFMAPEVLSSKAYPASDLWAAGVMAYQLLSGRFPFDDWKNPGSPALSLVWRSILTEQPNVNNKHWEDITEPAKDFVKTLLQRDWQKRPTAREALNHPWLQGRSVQRMEGRPLSKQVVQRLQRFGQASLFKRTVLDMIANELLQKQAQDASTHGPSTHGPRPSGGSLRGGQLFVTLLGNGSVHGMKKSRSVHGALELYKTLGDIKQSSITPPLLSPRVSDATDMAAAAAVQNPVADSGVTDAVSDPAASLGSMAAVDGPAAGGGGDYGYHNGPCDAVGDPASSLGSMAAVDGPADGGGGDYGYHGPVKDAAAAASRDLQLMARMVGEGSSHGPQLVKILTDAQQLRHDHQIMARLALGPEGSLSPRENALALEGEAKAAPQLQPDLLGNTPEAVAMDQEGQEGGPSCDAQAGRGASDPLTIPAQETPYVEAPVAEVDRADRQPSASSLVQAGMGPDGQQSEADVSPGAGTEGTVERADRQPSASSLGQAGTGPEGTEAPAVDGRLCDADVSASAPMGLEGGGDDERGGGRRMRPILSRGRSSELGGGGGDEEGGKRRREGGEAGRRGQAAYLQFVQAQDGVTPGSSPPASTPLDVLGAIRTVAPLHTLQRKSITSEPGGDAASFSSSRERSMTFGEGGAATADTPGARSDSVMTLPERIIPVASRASGVARDPSLHGLRALSHLVGDPSQLEEAKVVLRQLQFGQAKEVSAEQFGQGLQKLGYRLEPTEVEELMEVIAPGSGHTLSRSQFIASQVDWQAFQSKNKEEWLECLRSAFGELDSDRDGLVNADDICRLLRDKLPDGEIEMAVGDALMEAAADAHGMDFEQFTGLLRMSSHDSLASLDQYESRLQDGSVHGQDGVLRTGMPSGLETVLEAP